ncbi:helix-turn-helix domain-containing protein [Candidatus Bathyarchaeota archaeon]|nr:helix-turn-helix domain-containing protein [Candidatus Bathyarchaeota archaeon]
MSKVQVSSTNDNSVYTYLVELCREITSSNQLIKLDRLYRIARRELDVDSKCIIQGIQQLQDNLVIRQNSRLMREDLLDNETRREIYALVKLNPGITFNAIRKRMGRGTKVLLWHLEVLQEFDCIHSMSFDRKSNALFTRDIAKGEWEETGLYLFFMYHNETTKQILDLLHGDKSFSVKELARVMEVTRQAVDYQLKQLLERGIIDHFTEKVGRRVRRYFLPRRVKHLYAKVKRWMLGDRT